MNDINPVVQTRPAYAEAVEVLAECMKEIRGSQRKMLENCVRAGGAINIIRAGEPDKKVLGLIFKSVALDRRRASEWGFLYDYRADIASCKSIGEALKVLDQIKPEWRRPVAKAKPKSTLQEVRAISKELPSEQDVFPDGDLEAQAPPETAKSVIEDLPPMPPPPPAPPRDPDEDLSDAIFEAAIKQQQKDTLDENRAQSAPLPTEKKKARSALGIVVRACYDVGIYEQVREALNKMQQAFDALKG